MLGGCALCTGLFIPGHLYMQRLTGGSVLLSIQSLVNSHFTDFGFDWQVAPIIAAERARGHLLVAVRHILEKRARLRIGYYP